MMNPYYPEYPSSLGDQLTMQSRPDGALPPSGLRQHGMPNVSSQTYSNSQPQPQQYEFIQEEPAPKNK